MRNIQPTETMTFRIEADLRKIFIATCADDDTTASQVLRQFIRDYVRKNAQGSLLK